MLFSGLGGIIHNNPFFSFNVKFLCGFKLPYILDKNNSGQIFSSKFSWFQGATTLSIMTLGIMTFGIMTLSIATLSITTLSITIKM